MKLDLLFLAQTSQKMMQVRGFHYVMKDLKTYKIGLETLKEVWRFWVYQVDPSRFIYDNLAILNPG